MLFCVGVGQLSFWLPDVLEKWYGWLDAKKGLNGKENDARRDDLGNS